MFQAVDMFLQLRTRLGVVREQDDGWILASLDYETSDSALKQLLTELHNDGVISEFRRDGSRVFPPDLGESGLLELRIDMGNLPGYFETHDALVQRYPDAPPDEYHVWKESKELDSSYEAAVLLLSLLKTKAEVWDTTQQRFYLVDQQAIEIPLVYGAAQTIALAGIVPDIAKFLNSEQLDDDTRWAFFRKASIRVLRDIPKEKRLGFLFENLANVFERCQQDYSLYLERFSFEDLLKNFDEKRLKFVGDLNQVLSAVQTALIAVPIGFFLIAEKFKPADGLIGQNVILATGGLVFFALLFVLSLNQGKTLQGVKLALTAFEAEQKKKITDKSSQLQELLTSTWSQYNRVRLLLWLVRGLLLVFSIIVGAAILWCSIPSWQQRFPYLPKPDASTATKTLIVVPTVSAPFLFR
jgi:hypothetical protein